MLNLDKITEFLDAKRGLAQQYENIFANVTGLRFLRINL
jgi:hypothetical protein